MALDHAKESLNFFRVFRVFRGDLIFWEMNSRKGWPIKAWFWLKANAPCVRHPGLSAKLNKAILTL